MAFKIRRYLKTKRAPKTNDSFGGRYTPAGIDIYTTDDPDLVRLSKYDFYTVRVEELIWVLDELDTYESRNKFDGEGIELRLDMVKPEDKKGDVYHRSGFIVARPHKKHKGLVCLSVFSGYGLGSFILTAERNSLREALEARHKLAELAKQDVERYESS